MHSAGMNAIMLGMPQHQSHQDQQNRSETPNSRWNPPHLQQVRRQAKIKRALKNPKRKSTGPKKKSIASRSKHSEKNTNEIARNVEAKQQARQEKQSKAKKNKKEKKEKKKKERMEKSLVWLKKIELIILLLLE